MAAKRVLNSEWNNNSRLLQCKCYNWNSWYSWTCLCSLITRPVMHPRASSPNPREVYPLVIQQLTYHLSVCVRYLQFTASQCHSRSYFAIQPTFIMDSDWHIKLPPYPGKLSITFILLGQHPWFVSIACYVRTQITENTERYIWIIRV